MTTLNELEALAKAATPGPWHSPGIGEIHNEKCVVIASIDFPHEHNENEGGTQQDADFIAAANPQVILQLIALIRQMGEALEYVDKHWHGGMLGLHEDALNALKEFDK